MALLDAIKNRRSIRKYRDEQIPRENLEKIIEAGTYASNAGGGQQSMIVGIRCASSFGVYACSPEDSSFTAIFTNMEITECKWLAHDRQAPD